jgi:hypothetical protein
VQGTELFEGEIDALGAYMTVEKSPDLGLGEAFGGADHGLADAADDGIDGRAVEEKTSTGLAVVPHGECGLEMADLDERAAVERGVDGAETEDLGFGAAGGGSVDVGPALTEGGITIHPEFTGGFRAAEEELRLALRPLEDTAQLAG